MLGWTLRILVAAAIVIVIVRFGLAAMRHYVHGAMAETDRDGAPTTIEVGGDLRLRCPTCGFEVRVLRVPETEKTPYQLVPVRHCREEMVAMDQTPGPGLST